MVLLEGTIKTKDELLDILKKNPGIIVLKLGAEWCGPCKRIEPAVNKFFDMDIPNCYCIKIDVDESINLFAMYKRFRVLNGVPGLLCYTQEQDDIFPEIVCNSGDIKEVEKFFEDSLSFLEN